MAQLIRLMGLVLLGTALMVGVGISGDAKKDKDASKDKETPKDKITHRTPSGWKSLKLTADQKKKVYAIQDEYGVKINELKAKIADIEAQEMAEMVKVLTADQKALLTKALIGDAKDKAPPADKSPPPKDKDK